MDHHLPGSHLGQIDRIPEVAFLARMETAKFRTFTKIGFTPDPDYRNGKPCYRTEEVHYLVEGIDFALCDCCRVLCRRHCVDYSHSDIQEKRKISSSSDCVDSIADRYLSRRHLDHPTSFSASPIIVSAPARARIYNSGNEPGLHNSNRKSQQYKIYSFDYFASAKMTSAAFSLIIYTGTAI